ncbi:MAG: diguanylate cyclase [Mariprofundales bacterium]
MRDNRPSASLLSECPVTALVVGMSEEGFADLEQQWASEQQLELFFCNAGESPQKIAAHRGVTVVLEQLEDLEQSQSLEAAVQIVRAYRASEVCSDIPMILLTPVVSPQAVTILLQAGADVLLQFPIYLPQLLLQMRVMSHTYFDRIEAESLRQALLKTRRQLKDARAQVQELVEVDVLTGLISAARFQQTYDAEWQRAMRETNPIALLLIEIDCFEGYIAQYGQRVADDCLRQVAQKIFSCLSRTTDVAARCGSGSFAVLLPTTPASGGIKVGAKIHQVVQEMRLANEASTIDGCVTVSLGLATTSPMVRHTAQMLQLAASKALANAQAHGGGQLACEAI